MDIHTIGLIALGVCLVLSVIYSIGRDTFDPYLLKRSPNSLLLPLIFSRLLKTIWKVIVFVFIVIWMGVLGFVGVPFGIDFLLCFVLVPITVSLLARILKANIWKDDKPPSVVVLSNNDPKEGII
jgi:hypothetical protein